MSQMSREEYKTKIKIWLKEQNYSKEAFQAITWLTHRVALRKWLIWGNESIDLKHIWHENTSENAITLVGLMVMPMYFSATHLRMNFLEVNEFTIAPGAVVATRVTGFASNTYPPSGTGSSRTANARLARAIDAASASRASSCQVVNFSDVAIISPDDAAFAASVATSAALYAASYAYATAYPHTYTTIDSTIASSSVVDLNWLIKMFRTNQNIYSVEWPGLWTANYEFDCNQCLQRILIAYKEVDLGWVSSDLELMFSWHLNKFSVIHRNVEFARVEQRWQNYFKLFNLTKGKEYSAAELRGIVEGYIDTEVQEQVRVLLVGPGGAGKTSLLKLLQNKPLGTATDVTLGIQPHEPLRNEWREILSIAKTGETNAQAKARAEQQLGLLEPFAWDFGGQAIYLGLHSLFFTEQSVFVVVVDSRHEQAPDEWLYQILHQLKTLAKQNGTSDDRTQVLVVTNWHEGCHRKQNESFLLHEFPQFLNESSFYYFDFSKVIPKTANLEFSGFMQQLIQCCNASKRSVTKDEMDCIQVVREELPQSSTIDNESLLALFAKKLGRNVESNNIIPMLTKLGYVCPLDDETQLINPNFVIENGYQLLSKANESPVSKGCLRRTELNNLAKNFSDQFRQLLKDKGFCQEVKLGNTNYDYFPAAAAEDDPKWLFEGNSTPNFILSMTAKYLPNTLQIDLIQQYWQEDSFKDIWRSGMVIRLDNKCYFVVRFLSRKAEVEIQSFGNNMELMWRELKTLVETITKKLSVAENVRTFITLDSNILGRDESICYALNDYKIFNDNWRCAVSNILVSGQDNQVVTGAGVASKGDHNKLATGNSLIVDNSQNLTNPVCAELQEMLATLKTNPALNPRVIDAVEIIAKTKDIDKLPEEHKGIVTKGKELISKIIGISGAKLVENGTDLLQDFVIKNAPALIALIAAFSN